VPDAVAEKADPWVLVRGVALSQAGVVTRSQALGCGLSDELLGSLIRSRRWRRVHPGVYVTFTGPLPWAARVWSAVLACGSGAVVSGCCALRLYGMRLDHNDTDPVHISVDRSRRVKSHEGIILHRISRLADLTHPGRRPPVMRFEHAVLQHAVVGGLVNAVGILADSCQQRLTTPGRLALALRAKKRLPMRKKLLEIIEDVATGAYSYLELAYLRRVERPHGLPRATRQGRTNEGGRIWFRDVSYVIFATVIELDGRLGHESADDRWADLERDLNTACHGGVTVRIGYGQVLGDPCRTAAAVAMLLHRRGWSGRLIRCGPDCRLT
jgi:hypothetical protein